MHPLPTRQPLHLPLISRQLPKPIVASLKLEMPPLRAPMRIQIPQLRVMRLLETLLLVMLLEMPA